MNKFDLYQFVPDKWHFTHVSPICFVPFFKKTDQWLCLTGFFINKQNVRTTHHRVIVVSGFGDNPELYCTSKVYYIHEKMVYW